ncbi:MAG: AAA family ATPase [Deltaproteobacteria bacterium]|nr:AAA family ATPase [Deltaproteobacteria bacterium]
MYKRFFGFRERPFQLVPNPAYLYLSRSHEEALAHLAYSVAQGDGFVEITGEVGTGKTTLCRAFLESLDENTEAAYIFNPKLDSLQLLKAINDEFGLPSDASNTKDLIDILNSFLLEKKREGKRVIVLIDEAQNLTTEVLEQLRLLSNLETTTSKLLQIILVGQPELGEKLDSHELRQLGQRITLSCHIHPLSFRETRDYIRHRIQVASQKSPVPFTRAALKVIYRYSGGVPRLVNIACDRALLTAFGLNTRRVTGTIARSAVRELAARGERRRLWRPNWRIYLPALTLTLLVLAVVFYRPAGLRIGGWFRDQRSADVGQASRPVGVETGDPAGTVPKELDQEGREPTLPRAKVPPDGETARPANAPASQEMEQAGGSGDFGEFLAGLDGRESRSKALQAVLSEWEVRPVLGRYLEDMKNDTEFFRLAAKQNGLNIYRIKGDFGLLRKLNLPAILRFRTKGKDGPRYLALQRIEDQKITLARDENGASMVLARDEVSPFWSGEAYVPWKNFLGFEGTIPMDAPGDSVIALKMYLQELGFGDIEINPTYDPKTRDAIMLIQEKHGIYVDGIVGPATKIALYNEKKDLQIPHLSGNE